MKIETQIDKISSFQDLELIANQVVEGFISGMHKSPFHGFSSEFAEHKLYNAGESTKHIDWKLFAKTDRLYTKQYQEETNLRCHIIVDNSSSMHYPKLKDSQNFFENKIGFSVLAAAVLTNVLKKQRDAVGLSVFSDTYEYYAPEKGSDRHHRMLLHTLEGLLIEPATQKLTSIITLLHQIAEKIPRRSMIIVFTDMFQSGNQEELFNALQHLRHNKNKVILFHVVASKTELNFDFDTAPKKFIDLETGEEVAVFANTVKESYQEAVENYLKKITATCTQNQIKYICVNIEEKFEKILFTYFLEKQNFG